MADKKAIKRGAFLQAAGATAAGAALVSTGAGKALYSIVEQGASNDPVLGANHRCSGQKDHHRPDQDI